MDINFVCAMGPPGGGRNAVTPRLTRHFNYLSFAEMDDISKKRIFSTILGSWVGKYRAGVGRAVGSSRSPGPVSHTGKSGGGRTTGSTPYSALLPLASLMSRSEPEFLHLKWVTMLVPITPGCEG